ncbi:hypothetical protein RBB75_15285 [Tunturibacter empetritectus]
MFDPAAGDKADPQTASLAVWFDAFILNVDRTPRNANLLNWHSQLYFIDHGAALYFHHNWPDTGRLADSPFADVRSHILLPWASKLEEVALQATTRLNAALLHEILAQIPDEWLQSSHPTPAEARAAYLDLLTRRLAASPIFTQEAVRARAHLI